jgi:protein-disulfide isomerase
MPMKKYLIATAVILAVGAFVAYEYTSFSHPAPETESAAAEPSPSAPALPTQPQPDANQPNDGFPFHDTSILKPPAGAKVAIYEFEDLECPACAQAFPLVHAAAAQYKVPLVRRDYPWPFHAWSFDAAVTARYIEDTISPSLADTFRGDVFANQASIASKEDLDRFTRSG